MGTSNLKKKKWLWGVPHLSTILSKKENVWIISLALSTCETVTLYLHFSLAGLVSLDS